ncbi:hypothetical protein [Lactobacillus taiwanensis]|uniref:Uncharacterized protein n=1 Tax=Lactobacillus taiwanensis TaxID=508451 RepID=A0A256LC22_9LACO|nr:hypothetical protein [Lactobacillus taiwanensis]OYR87344.1 hypothetical protein CBF53_07800 [Lactobacillus taiwanensis]OYR90965.1 hypothetical protein CBF70_07245 [Lactobacillus taiwanensis]OYR91871.1 hypothetical protein CBF59_05030 [Lactobacillus taiwanensis]
MLKILLFMTLFSAPVHNYSPLGKVEIRQTINTNTFRKENILLTPTQAHQLDKYGEIASDDLK